MKKNIACIMVLICILAALTCSMMENKSETDTLITEIKLENISTEEITTYSKEISSETSRPITQTACTVRSIETTRLPETVQTTVTPQTTTTVTIPTATVSTAIPTTTQSTVTTDPQAAAAVIVTTTAPITATSITTTSEPELITAIQIENVPVILQNDVGLNSGCEIVSATMLLNYCNYELSPLDTCKYVKFGNSIYGTDQLYATDPNIAFVGDPTSSKSYGCYAPVIVDTINNIIAEFKGSESAENISGCTSDELFEYINNGYPIAVWTTINMREATPGTSWIIEGTNNVFTWITPEHVIVLTGYDKDYVYVNDPLNGNTKYKKDLFISRWNQLNNQAVVII